MDLKSGYPFWAIRNGLMQAYPSLETTLQVDVAIVGGGISAALIARELSAHGHEVALLEQRDIGWGSTAASTALLQYEIDTHMVDLAKRHGEADAVLAYQSCAQAIDTLTAIAREVGDVDFARNDSLYYASRSRHRATLADECALRARHGLDVTWLERDALLERYALDAPAAILSTQAAGVDPYRLTYRLLARLRKAGVHIYDRTRISALQAGPRAVQLTTGTGHHITARHVVLAAGYANEHWLKPRVARNRSSYAFVTDPLHADMLGPLRDTLLWESARPYLYLRTTRDNRLVIGGEDDRIDIPAKRDARVGKKAATLLHKVRALFPHLDIAPAFAWAGTFAETEDGLPFFGPHSSLGPRVQFAMAYGGNGITYSMLGAGLLRAIIERRRHPLRALFSFERLGLD
ncbi:MAG: FAD-dependent oxidoreductase [Pseudoxanthomonas sp.]